jgi:thioredoxin 2
VATIGLAAALGAPAFGQDAAAPSLDEARWIAAGPVPELGERLLVVEVWATWCGPCHATFPLLTRLQREHADRVRVVAISDDSAEAVRRTFHARPDAMRFAIGVVDEATVQAFLFGGFGGRGLPSTFLVEGGRVVWGGPPDQLEAALVERLAAAQPTIGEAP